MPRELDSVDRGILYMLQIDARNTTSQEIADKVGVSASTVRNRIERLEDDSIVEGYYPEIDYEAANLSFRVKFVITAPIENRSDIVEKLMDIQGVVSVSEMLTGKKNIHAKVVGKTTADIARVTESIAEMGAEVESSELVRQHLQQPFNHFYFSEAAEGIDLSGNDAE